MAFQRFDLEQIIFEPRQGLARFTQDSPVYPDVWLAYAEIGPLDPVDLLLSPNRESSPAELFCQIRDRLGHKELSGVSVANGADRWRLSTSGRHIAVALNLRQLICVALPLTKWWRDYVRVTDRRKSPHYEWLVRIVSAVRCSQRGETPEQWLDASDHQASLREFLANVDPEVEVPQCLWSVSRNRAATCQLEHSVPATKADACQRLFKIDGANVRWAVIDSGIDATHMAFRRRSPSPKGPVRATAPFSKQGHRWRNHTRVVETYDFTRLRDLTTLLHLRSVSPEKAEAHSRLRSLLSGRAGDGEGRRLSKKRIADLCRTLELGLSSGRMLEWSALAPLLQLPHNPSDYVPPAHPHGTHVAGIIGADGDDGLTGMAPGVELYDLRTMKADGTGDEFAILAALQFIRWLNAQHDYPVIHGLNISIAIRHDVANYAAGRTPVCEECSHLVGEGVVVVAAAGNRGRAVFLTSGGGSDEGFRTVGITDPGNADAVITVGATHRNKPHTYGVSYFSSRGPTGDGRVKPDLLAPGEKIKSTIPGDDVDFMDGTSMAAPHVSGAAALLLARNRELIGHPQRVKDILCSSATDLGRERYYQGYGMLDTLRALQSV